MQGLIIIVSENFEKIANVGKAPWADTTNHWKGCRNTWNHSNHARTMWKHVVEASLVTLGLWRGQNSNNPEMKAVRMRICLGINSIFASRNVASSKENPDENPDLSGRPCNLPRKSARITHSKNGIAGPINCDLLKMIWLVLQMVHFLVGGLEHVLFSHILGMS
jgi:hypothetical protein